MLLCCVFFQQLHKFFPGDGFFFQKIAGQNVQLVFVFPEDISRLLVGRFYNLYDKLIDPGSEEKENRKDPC